MVRGAGFIIYPAMFKFKINLFLKRCLNFAKNVLIFLMRVFIFKYDWKITQDGTFQI
jgi:hypothetical protein